MLLIFPSIEIRRGQCVQLVRGEIGTEEKLSLDPVQMAILWRGENAKTLHVIDLDGAYDGTLKNKDIIREIVRAVDIPIQVGGGIRTYEDVRDLLELGVFRVAIGTASVENPDLIKSLIKEFGSRQIAITIESSAGKIKIERGRKTVEISPIEHAKAMKKLGVCRFIYATIDEKSGKKIFDPNELKEIAAQTSVRVTAQGGINNYLDLLKLQTLEKYGVDSIIMGKPLYENYFPCQRLWRLNERDLSDLGPTRRF